ncbi:MAG: IS91 family transposase [Candidatus Aminicenantaceae bacterium]
MGKANLEVADIFCEYGGVFHRKFGKSLSREQLRTIQAIKICRTAELGGHIDRCDNCGHEVISYNSCRNRHCPKCQSLAKARWLEARETELLSADYFHVVFTIPKALNQIVLQNKREVYDILFKAVAQTLLTIAADRNHLGAKIGFMAVLHTWGQNLLLHPHIHCLIPGGGLSHDEKKWIECKKKFLLPVRVLSRLFRRLFLEFLIKSFNKGRLKFYGKTIHLSDPKLFSKLIEKCFKTEWVVYSKPPFGGPEKVLDYLSRYTHRIAISNNRLLRLEDGKVTFTWRNYKNGKKLQNMTLQAEEFIRRFLLHVLPSGFMRIRYFGFLSNRHRNRKLKHCRELLRQKFTNSILKSMDWKKHYEYLTGNKVDLCPLCGKGHMITCQKLLPLRFLFIRPPPQRASNDFNTSKFQIHL